MNENHFAMPFYDSCKNISAHGLGMLYTDEGSRLLLYFRH